MNSFELTPELLQVLIFAVEDQNNTYVFNTEKLILESEPKESASFQDRQPSFWETHCKLPSLNSAEAYNLRQQFILTLNNAELSKKLTNALNSGKGAFKNFKSVFSELPEYSEFEKIWKQYKKHYLISYINTWYSTIQGEIECNKLPIEPEDDYDDLVLDSFSIVEQPNNLFSLKSDKNSSDNNNPDKNNSDNNDSDKQPEDNFRKDSCYKYFCPKQYPSVDSVFERINQWVTPADMDQNEKFAVLAVKMHLNKLLGKTFCSFVAENTLKEQVGFISCFSTAFDETFFVISELLVLPKARDLGIGKKLLEAMINKLKNTNCNLIIIWEPFIPQFFIPTLEKLGFTSRGGLWILKLSLE